MKINLILFLLTFTAISCQASPSPSELINQATDYEVLAQEQSNDLENIQQKIFQAFVQTMVNNNTDQLDQVDSMLKALHEKQENNLVQYWRSYLNFYKAIAYLQLEDREQAEKEIDQAVSWMSNMDKKNSEDFALLAMVQSFSIQFKAGIKAPFIANKVSKNGKLAMSMDETNPRAYYVLGSSDFYTPEQYGGGKEVEQLLIKAISLPAQATPNPYLPSWGIEESYEMLIKFYIRQERWADAKEFYKKASKAYPNNYQIGQLASQLIDK